MSVIMIMIIMIIIYVRHAKLRISLRIKVLFTKELKTIRGEKTPSQIAPGP